MAPTALQTKRSTITTAGLSISATFDSTPAAGNLLFASLGIDKSAGSITAPSGWTLLGSPYIDASVSGAIAYKIAAGNESSVQWNWTTSTRAGMTLTETNLTGAAVMGTVQRTAVSGSGVTSVSLTGSSSTGQGVSFGVASVDSGLGGAWAEGEPTWSSGYTPVVVEPGDAFAGATSNGGACSAVAWKTLANGTATGFTASWTGADQAFGYLVNFSYTGESGATAPQSIGSLWVGGVTATTAKLKVKATSGASVTVRYSTSSSMAGATTTPAVTADGTGMAEISLSGLASGTTYHYRVALAGVDASNGSGSFRTAPVDAASFSFAHASCRSHAVATQTVFDRIRDAAGLLFFLLTGDKGYQDVNSTTASLYRAIYDDLTQQANVASMLRKLWMPDVWSDHDFCGNGSHAGSTGAATAQTVYRERVPTYPLPSPTGIYYTFVVGRVRFVVLDTRSFRSNHTATDNSSKVMLGATQEQWLYDTLAAATESLIFIVSAEPWIGGGNQDDHWGSFQTEQTRIVSNVPAATWRKVVWLCGDAHMLGFDDGTNSPGGSPVWHAAALDRTGSTKGGPYSGGTFAGSGQYGRVDVVDNGGSDITATWTGVKSDGTTWATTSWTPSSTVGNFTLWDGSAEVPLVHEGVWDGSAVVPSASVEVVA